MASGQREQYAMRDVSPVLSRRRKQAGFSIVSAVFLLVVLASLGAFLVNISATQHTALAQDVQGSRAFHAAQAGLEWGLYQVLDPTNVTALATSPGSANWPNMPPCPANTSLTIEGFGVAVTCASFPGGGAVYTESGDVRSIIVYELTATASSVGEAVGSAHYVERQVRATVSKCRSTDAVASPWECSGME